MTLGQKINKIDTVWCYFPLFYTIVPFNINSKKEEKKKKKNYIKSVFNI